jgi:hypothetical protein
LTEEAASLDWTKSKGHTLNSRKNIDSYEEEFSYPPDEPIIANKLGGEVNLSATPRDSSVAAAYRRFINVSAGNPDEKSFGPTRSLEPVTEDLERMVTVSEPDPDDALTEINLTFPKEAERTADNAEKIMVPFTEEDLVTRKVLMDLDEKNFMEPDPDESTAVTRYQTATDQGDHRELQELHSSFEPEPDNRINSLMSEDIQRIEEPVAELCSRLQKAIQMLRSEVNPLEVPKVLQTLYKIIRSVVC